ncbi:MAG: hypothetical protein K8J09_17600 [Planctomycetes bacterium]|nr:hypothetical protein [Planctomycetota bacterium]MCC7399307.1 hypothetical protein [Planctomycetota bacterium]
MAPQHAAPWWRRRSLLAAFAFLLAVACATFVPQQGWNPAAGPVVPHDSFPADCSLCHQGGNWHTLRADFTFDHAKETGVPLAGAHAQAGCLLCHNDRGPVAKFAARGCAGCHADPHSGQLGANCGDCHDERAWRPREMIERHDRTRFPLVGAHAAAACFRCHPGAQVGNFAGAPIECIACHQANFAGTTDPNHVVLQFSTQCETCHLPVGWQPARFEHPVSFPLSHGHAGRACRECHTTPNSFGGLSTDCASCHTDDYNATSEPSHVAAGLPTDCAACHDTRTFQQADWQHPGTFALTFGHAGRRCSQCHVNQVYTGTPTDCVGCHQTDYNNTTDPNHAVAGFGTDCAVCHDTRDWQGAIGHPDSFPLTNAHNRSCTECHTTPGTYIGLSTDCVSCHLADFQATTTPNHTTAGFGTDCVTCHGTADWHSAVGHPVSFPLTNGHNRTCTACHTTPGVYTGLSTTCVSCHLAQYQATTDPPHASFQMSQQCQDCHTTLSWGSGTWTHQFPITSGDHGNLECFDCHNNPANRLDFSCIDCHEHRQTAMNSEHNGVQGYVWATANCYQCHPTGHQ